MSTILLLVRHCHIDKIVIKSMGDDTPLTETGRKSALALAQDQAVAEYIKGASRFTILSDQVLRCRQTVAPLHEKYQQSFFDTFESMESIIRPVNELAEGEVVLICYRSEWVKEKKLHKLLGQVGSQIDRMRDEYSDSELSKKLSAAIYVFAFEQSAWVVKDPLPIPIDSI